MVDGDGHCPFRIVFHHKQNALFEPLIHHHRHRHQKLALKRRHSGAGNLALRQQIFLSVFAFCLLHAIQLSDQMRAPQSFKIKRSRRSDRSFVSCSQTLSYMSAMSRIFVTFACLIFTTLAQAGQTPWVDVAPDTRLRLIFSDVLTSEAETMMALELEMPPGTKTYWRVPGETGIPLTLDNSNSTGLGEAKVIWPFPERLQTYGYVDYVYQQNLILPIKLQVKSSNPRLDMKLILGVCSEVCIPVSVQITHDLTFDARDNRVALQIAQNIANSPIPWDQQDNPFGRIYYDLASEQLRIEVSDSQIDMQTMIPTIENSFVMFGMPQKSQTEGLVAFEKLGGDVMQDLAGKNLTLTFMSPDGPYEYSMPLILSE
ncbi:MAG TPA: hypothetical protein ENK61_00520 [Devosia sp.]|nr:hypothetical protein [Devosia sp.]